MWSEESPSEAPLERPITPRDLAHWAYKPLARVAPPAVKGAGHVRTPVDSFVLARLEDAGLEPLPEADRGVLARRLAFDLAGLPPEPAEVDAFLADPAPDAYERLADRLLASPAYGERWAQHWLDLARFAESDGFEQDELRPNAWRYRDWVIEALDRDLPYDEFVRLQIAGDELRPEEAGAVVATGFALCGQDMSDINSQEERRHMVLNELTATVGSVFLGLQFGCAQCHDHKADPVSQADFYRLRAFFDQVELFKERPLPMAAGAESEAPLGRVLREESGERRRSFLMVRGDWRRRGPELRPAFPRIADPEGTPVEPVATGSSGLRTVLARWLTRPDHPLAGRVAANRLWYYHFGAGLAREPSDFGLMGEAPSHPHLLDWLASELPRREWSLKRMHRLIVCSSAYRRASRPGSPSWSEAEAARARELWGRAVVADTENRLLGRRSRRRLEAEAIRDALLAVSGQISTRRGGPGVMPPLPEEVRKSIRKDHWRVSPDPEDHRRRSVYLFVRRNLRYPFLEVFDRPDTAASCARRNRTTIAPQALALLNSELAVEAAQALARRVATEGGPAGAFRLALGRPPSAEERELAERVDLTTLCLSLFNLNEFVYVD